MIRSVASVAKSLTFVVVYLWFMHNGRFDFIKTRFNSLNDGFYIGAIT